MTSGIIDRFRTMAIARSAVLAGHVLASLCQSLFGVGVVLGVAVALGFRPDASALDWLAVAGTLVLFSFALFNEGWSGLTITIGAILTLFVMMQLTGRIRWGERFAEATS